MEINRNCHVEDGVDDLQKGRDLLLRELYETFEPRTENSAEHHGRNIDPVLFQIVGYPFRPKIREFRRGDRHGGSKKVDPQTGQ